MLFLPLAMASASQGPSHAASLETAAIAAARADLASLQVAKADAAIIKAAEDVVQRLEDLRATRAQLDADLQFAHAGLCRTYGCAQVSRLSTIG